MFRFNSGAESSEGVSRNVSDGIEFTVVDFWPFCTRKNTYVTCFLCCMLIRFWKGFNSLRKLLAPCSLWEPILYFYSINLFIKGQKHFPTSVSTADTNIKTAHDKTYTNTRDQRRLRSACAFAQSDQSLRWSHVPSTASRLSKAGWMRTLAILGGCTGWFESLLVTQILL